MIRSVQHSTRLCWWVTDIARVFQKRDVDVTGPGLLLLVYTVHWPPINSGYLCRMLGRALKASQNVNFGFTRGKSRVSIPIVKTPSCLAWKHHIVSVFGRNYRAFIRWTADRFCAPSLFEPLRRERRGNALRKITRLDRIIINVPSMLLPFNHKHTSPRTHPLKNFLLFLSPSGTSRDSLFLLLLVSFSPVYSTNKKIIYLIEWKNSLFWRCTRGVERMLIDRTMDLVG